MDLEKKARLAADQDTTIKSALLCMELSTNDLTSYASTLSLLCRRRGQFRSVQKKVVEHSLQKVYSLKNDEDQLIIIEVVRKVSEGKIFLEVDRARLTKRLSEIQLRTSNVAVASKTLQSEQVESYGEMPKREKFEYLLEQMRLTTLESDFVRANIIANKVTRGMLEEPKDVDLKIKFLELRVSYYSHEKNTLELCRTHLSLYKARSSVVDLKLSSLYCATSESEPSQIDLLNTLLMEEKLKKELFQDFTLLQKLSKTEIIAWPLGVGLKKVIEGISDDLLNRLNERIVEHNVVVVSEYYDRISLKRLSSFLSRTENETEKVLGRMVIPPITSNVKPLIAKIDRPLGIVRFGKRETSEFILTSWVDRVSQLLNLVDDTSRLVSKEIMLAEST